MLELPDGRIIDGYHRWLIAGDGCPYRVLDISEDKAFALGLPLNIARRQLTPEQISEIHEQLRRDKELRKQVAVEMRKQGKSLRETAAIVGVDKSTVSKWAKELLGVDFSTPSKVAVRVTEEGKQELYERYKSGESQKKLAAEYKISQQRVSQIIRQVEARKREPEPVETPELPSKRYKCIVVDPPWPVPGWELPSQGSPQ